MKRGKMAAEVVICWPIGRWCVSCPIHPRTYTDPETIGFAIRRCRNTIPVFDSPRAPTIALREHFSNPGFSKHQRSHPLTGAQQRFSAWIALLAHPVSAFNSKKPLFNAPGNETARRGEHKTRDRHGYYDAQRTHSTQKACANFFRLMRGSHQHRHDRIAVFDRDPTMLEYGCPQALGVNHHGTARN
jgi:hypothetical protein